MKKLCLVLLAAALLLSGCVSKSGSAPLVGDWKLTAYGPIDSPQEAVPSIEVILTFEARDRVSGNLGCNQFGGEYKIKGDQITFDDMESTLMACSGPQMQQEQAAFTIMAGSANYKIESSTLQLPRIIKYSSLKLARGINSYIICHCERMQLLKQSPDFTISKSWKIILG